HDVTTGNNLYYSSTAAWDYPTGWGSYDANDLARDLAGITSVYAACTSANLQESPRSPQPVGTSITITAAAGGCTSPQYQFWVHAPTGSWALAQNYSSSSTFTWNTPGLASGTYRFEVHVHAMAGSTTEASAASGSTHETTP